MSVYGTAYSGSSQGSTHSRKCTPLSVWTGWEWEDQAFIIERFLSRLFGCSVYIDEPVCGMPAGYRLRDYIANVLMIAELKKYVWGALMFLNRVKERWRTKSYAHGHHIFFAAVMLSTKIFSDFSPNRWVEWAQGIPKRKIFQVERELCADLDWDFGCDPERWAPFIQTVCRDFRSGVEGHDVPWLFITTNKRPGIPRPQCTIEWDAVAQYHSQRRSLRPREPVGAPLPLPPIVAPAYVYPSAVPIMPYPFGWPNIPCQYPPVRVL